MPFTLSWSVGGEVGSGNLPASGTVQGEAMERVSLVVPASGSDTVVTGVTDIARLRFMVLGASRPDGVTFTVGAGPSLAMSGPVLLSGELAYLLGAGTPDVITVNNTGSDDVTVELLIYRDA
jgi:ABC-type enterobactin transport system permease subunit